MRKPLSFLLCCFVLALAAVPAAAQAPGNDAWHVTVVPYMLGAGMNGTSAVKGQEATIDQSFSDILSNLQFGAMGLVVARKGDWGVGGDAIWMALGTSAAGTGPVGLTAGADVNQGAFAFYGIRRLSPVADLLFGARINTIQANFRVNGPLAVRTVEGSKT